MHDLNIRVLCLLKEIINNKHSIENKIGYILGKFLGISIILHIRDICTRIHVVIPYFACTLDTCAFRTESIMSTKYLRLRPHYIQHSRLVIVNPRKKQRSIVYISFWKNTPLSEVHAFTARFAIVCGLRMCNGITVRHRKMFHNDLFFNKNVCLDFCLSCIFHWIFLTSAVDVFFSPNYCVSTNSSV